MSTRSCLFVYSSPSLLTYHHKHNRPQGWKAQAETEQNGVLPINPVTIPRRQKAQCWGGEGQTKGESG